MEQLFIHTVWSTHLLWKSSNILNSSGFFLLARQAQCRTVSPILVFCLGSTEIIHIISRHVKYEYICLYTIFLQSDAVATIYFAACFSAATS